MPDIFPPTCCEGEPRRGRAFCSENCVLLARHGLRNWIHLLFLRFAIQTHGFCVLDSRPSDLGTSEGGAGVKRRPRTQKPRNRCLEDRLGVTGRPSKGFECTTPSSNATACYWFKAIWSVMATPKHTVLNTFIGGTKSWFWGGLLLRQHVTRSA